jgi:cell division protein ZapE
MLDETLVVRTLTARGIVPDESQHIAIAAILALLGERRGSSAVRRTQGCRGVYCHGLPGRGKSLVVDTIFALADCSKRRIHFHEFLREIRQRQMSEPPASGDQLVMATRRWLAGIELLCFDEFHVHDIADAFLVGRFLDTALELGVRLVLTSNYPPEGLLPNPEYHERFRPTIERIRRDFTNIHFDGARDYRREGQQAGTPRFLTPLDAETAKRLEQLFLDAEDGRRPEPVTAEVARRPLAARAAGKSMLWADFDALCVAGRSHLDYLELADRWQGLIIDQLDVADLSAPSTLQRFIWLVDIFYDRRHQLLIASNLPLVTAIRDLDGAHDLSRTLSRLAEMQSRSYVEHGQITPVTQRARQGTKMAAHGGRTAT